MSIITSILGSDQPKDSRTVINTNFSNLNTDKVEKDANGNITANNFFANSATTVSAGGTTVMTVASARIQNLTGTTTQTFQLPDATTLVLSQLFLFNNNSSQSLTITNNGAVSQYVIPAGGAVEVYTTNISTANGTFDFHPLPPSTVTWWSGVTGLVMNSALTTTPTISAGASSSTAPSFIPQRWTLNTWFGWDSTNLYGIVWGTARMTVSTTGITATRITNRIWTETSSTTSTPTGDSVDQWNITALAVADAIAAPTGTPTDWQSLIIRIKDNWTARALTWNAIYRASTDLALPTTTIISKTMYCEFLYNSADSKWDFVWFLNNF